MSLNWGGDHFFVSLTDLLLLMLILFVSLGDISPVSKVNKIDTLNYRNELSIKALQTYLDTIPSMLFFDIGSDELSHSGKMYLNGLAAYSLPKTNKLIIYGHTDSTPISRKVIKSNWHLSALRAANVAMYLEAQGLPSEQLIVIGLANTNLDLKKNRPDQRRVEIKIGEVL
ncbi:MAG: OmpA family protein [Candidatus Margulisiibacteriota bacterium]